MGKGQLRDTGKAKLALRWPLFSFGLAVRLPRTLKHTLSLPAHSLSLTYSLVSMMVERREKPKGHWGAFFRALGLAPPWTSEKLPTSLRCNVVHSFSPFEFQLMSSPQKGFACSKAAAPSPQPITSRNTTLPDRITLYLRVFIHLYSAS